MVSLFSRQKVMTFLVIVLKNESNDLFVIGLPLAPFRGDGLSSVILNSAAKKIFIFIRVSPPGWCLLGCPPTSDATVHFVTKSLRVVKVMD